MTHAELISALEAASGPSRELDGWIFCAVHHPNERPQRNFFYMNREEWGAFISNQPRPGITFHDAPHYTESIDAALTLVPEGYRADMKAAPHRKGATALVWHDTEANGHADGPSYAIALCIATLKARSKP